MTRRAGCEYLLPHDGREKAESAMPMIRTFRDLDVWQAAMGLTLECYRHTQRFPSTERFALSDQIRRAAVSIAANVAEGHGRRNQVGIFRNHVATAIGSQAELDTLLEIAARLNYLSQEAYRSINDSVVRTGQLLGGLARSLRAADEY